MRLPARSLGLQLGELPAGRWNDITDVNGVLVGHCTVAHGDGPLLPGEGPVRTGVSIIRPHPGNIFKEKVPAAVHTINGFGKAVGFEQVREFGQLEAPIALTNTLNVGLVLDAMVSRAVRENPEIGVTTGTVNILVGETNDGFLNDIQGRHVRPEHVWQASDSVCSGPIQQGAVGAGAGTVCFGWKGGIGSASRVLSAGRPGYTVGALVQSNFGKPENLTISGIPIGKYFSPGRRNPGFQPPAFNLDCGSIMVILATDAPLDSNTLLRMCHRVPIGLARTGSMLGSGSGDFVVAFCTLNPNNSEQTERFEHSYRLLEQPGFVDSLFQAVVETVEEAVINSLFCAEAVYGRDKHFAGALPVDPVLQFIKKSKLEILDDYNDDR